MTCCPQCSINLGPDPYSVTLFDRTLQELVDQILPELQINDDISEREYYRVNGIKPKKEYIAEIEEETRLATQNFKNDAKRSSAEVSKEEANASGKTTPSPTRKRRKSKDKSPKKSNIPVPPDELDIEVYPDKSNYESPQKKRVRGARGRFQKSPPKIKDKKLDVANLSNPCIRTSGRLKISQLKKYLTIQLGLDTDQHSNLIIRCNGDVVGDELSLTFILRTRWLLPDENMIFHYSINKELHFK